MATQSTAQVMKRYRESQSGTQPAVVITQHASRISSTQSNPSNSIRATSSSTQAGSTSSSRPATDAPSESATETSRKKRKSAANDAPARAQPEAIAISEVHVTAPTAEEARRRMAIEQKVAVELEQRYGPRTKAEENAIKALEVEKAKRSGRLWELMTTAEVMVQGKAKRRQKLQALKGKREELEREVAELKAREADLLGLPRPAPAELPQAARVETEPAEEEEEEVAPAEGEVEASNAEEEEEEEVEEEEVDELHESDPARVNRELTFEPGMDVEVDEKEDDELETGSSGEESETESQREEREEHRKRRIADSVPGTSSAGGSSDDERPIQRARRSGPVHQYSRLSRR